MACSCELPSNDFDIRCLTFISMELKKENTLLSVVKGLQIFFLACWTNKPPLHTILTQPPTIPSYPPLIVSVQFATITSETNAVGFQHPLTFDVCRFHL